MRPTALKILGIADHAGCEIILPSDAVVATELAEGVPSQIVPAAAVPSDMMILDIGRAVMRSLL